MVGYHSIPPDIRYTKRRMIDLGPEKLDDWATFA